MKKYIKNIVPRKPLQHSRPETQKEPGTAARALFAFIIY